MKYVSCFLIVIAMLLGGCAHKTGHQPGPFQAPVSRATPAPMQEEHTFMVEDPWEGFNRQMYGFNAKLDRYVYLPVVSIYEQVLPIAIQSGISNIFNNFKEIPIFVNCVLQGKGKKASVSFGRFIFNTTIGLGGIVDVLGKGGLPQENEDFGQTLGHYGIAPGPYLVLPVYGPSGLRDAGGFAFDSVLLAFNPSDMLLTGLGWQARSAASLSVYSLKAVDARHQVTFRYYETGSPFEYEMVRYLYSKKRELDISK